MTRIHDVHQQLGFDDLLERGLERLDQAVRELADEPDGVGQQDVLVGRQAEPAGGRIERGEELVLGQRVGAGQRVEQGGFAGVGVADDRCERPLVALASGPLRRALLADDGKLVLELEDALGGLATVGLELGFAFAADGSGGTALPGKVGPEAGQPRHQVLELGQLDLQLAFAGARALGEDLEDQRGAVEQLALEDLLQVAALGAGQLVVEDDGVHLLLLAVPGELLRLARADVGARMRRLQLLRAVAHDLRADRAGQFGEFVERIADVQGGAGLQLHADEEGAIGFLAGGVEKGFQTGSRRGA